MASSSSKALMPSSSLSSSRGVMYSGKWEYDVFLCFRGADTWDGFTSHLMEALSREKIKAFIDDVLDKTESIDELISVLRRSAVSIVIFSENFADSRWCLDEVATISQSMVEFSHRVLPIFYRVDPSNVSEDSGNYAAVIEQKHGASQSPEDKKRWMDALKGVANCAGYSSQAIKIDSELVKAIVKDVLKRLIEMSSKVQSDNLIGMDAHIFKLEELLAMDKNDFRIVQLWGMGGVGKTTLARACYRRIVSLSKGIKHHLEGIKYNFVSDINQRCEKENGMKGIVTELYSALLYENNISCDDLDASQRRSRLSDMKVFLVFDDVGALWQLEQLFLGDLSRSTCIFAPGSRILLTTRNQMRLRDVEVRIYQVDILNPDESLQLFQMHAFGKRLPPGDWMDLSRLAISFCKGNPLAIKIFGGTLLDKDKNYWGSFLGDVRQIPTPGIHDVLKRSYNVLGVDEKRLFLDIACLFYRPIKLFLIKYYRADHLIKDLIDKSLIICFFDEDLDLEMIEVHDLLREVAWSIVNEELKLEKRTRLNRSDDIHKLLTISPLLEGGRATEGISLNLSQVNVMHLKANAFEGMTSLKFLDFSYPRYTFEACKVHVPYDSLFTLPESLRLLKWYGFPLKSLPSTFSPENLVALILKGSSKMERCWQGAQPELVNLIWLDLSHCLNLVAIPDLSMSLNLEYLVLDHCKSLTELPSYVQDLDKLIIVDLRNCTNLRSLPPKLDSKFLKQVGLSNCPKLTRCPEINSRELGTLDLMETPVVRFPSAIYNLKRGGFLRLCGKHITNFPEVSTSLKLFRLCHTTIREMDCYDDDHHQHGFLPRFVQLELVGNPQLKCLSKNIWNMVSKTLILEDCQAIESLPEILLPVNSLTHLSVSECRNLKGFPSGINNLISLQSLLFTDTDIKSLPACILELDQLSAVDLSYNKSLKFIPSNIHKLDKLSRLSLEGCLRIQFLPELPPNLLTLDVSSCSSLQALPSNIGRLRLKTLYFEDCPQLDMNLPIAIVHDFPNNAASNLHPQGVLQYSGSEIPEWFAYRRLNCENDLCLMVQLPPPPNSTTKQLIKGIAFGVVCSSDIGIIYMSISCDCHIGTTVAASWSSPVFGFGSTQSDNVYIWYEKNLLGGIKKVIQEAESWYERYAGRSVSFRFSLQPYKTEDPRRLKSVKIKRIGVSLLY